MKPSRIGPGTAFLTGVLFLSLYLWTAGAGEQTRTLRCWRCRDAFEVAAGTGGGECPSCRAPFLLTAPPGRSDLEPGGGGADTVKTA